MKTTSFQKRFNSFTGKENRNIIIILGEILYWLILIILSLIFIRIHEPLRVEDGYYKYAELIKALLLNDSYSTSDLDNIIFLRIIYPLLVALTSILLNISLFTAGNLVSVLSGFGCIFFMPKFLKLYNEDRISYRLERMAFGSSIAFIVYWAKFSTDILFCFFTIASIYYLSVIWKKGISFNYAVYYSVWTMLAFFTREIGFLLIYPLFFVLAKDKTKKIYITISAILTTITGLLGIIYVSLFTEHMIVAYNWFDVFYNEVWSFKKSFFQINFKNLLSAIFELLSFLFSPKALYNTFIAIIFSIGPPLFVLFLIFVFEKKISTKEIKKLHFLFKDLMPHFPFLIPYTLIIFFLQAGFMNERYLLPLLPFIFSILYLCNTKIIKNENFIESAKFSLLTGKYSYIMLIFFNLGILTLRFLILLLIF